MVLAVQMLGIVTGSVVGCLLAVGVLFSLHSIDISLGYWAMLLGFISTLVFATVGQFVFAELYTRRLK